MIGPPPKLKRHDTRFPYPTLCRSGPAVEEVQPSSKMHSNGVRQHRTTEQQVRLRQAAGEEVAAMPAGLATGLAPIDCVRRWQGDLIEGLDRKSTRLNSSH